MRTRMRVLLGGLALTAMFAGCYHEDLRARLAQARVSCLYESVTDGPAFERSLDQTIGMLKETDTEFVFRGCWRWYPIVESPQDVPSELLEAAAEVGVGADAVRKLIEDFGYHWRAIADSVSALKAAIPGVLFCAALPAQRLNRVERDDFTRTMLGFEQTWAMALDPQKWGVRFLGSPMTKDQFQRWYAILVSWLGPFEPYDPRRLQAYFPDITNPDFQELLVDWAKRQIQCGADAIWIDLLHAQATTFAQITGDPNHPSVREAFEAAARVVDRIHEYGASQGKYVFVGDWWQVGTPSETHGLPPGDLDFVTVSPSPEEVMAGALDAGWSQKVERARRIHGNVPIFSFFDWGWGAFDSPLTKFSQKLSKQQQREVLGNFDRGFADLGVKFIYPMHGGHMGGGATRLSYGKLNVYDSLAPEFETYGTIRDLAQAKAQ